MLDTLIREFSARWGLADQGRPLVQMLVAAISNPATGGLPGFLEKFRREGWGGMVNTWVDNNATPENPTTAQIETVLGGSSNSGLLNQLATRLNLPYDKITTAVAGLLPMLVGRMTPDGTIPSTLPAEFSTLAREGNALLGLGVGAGAATAGYGATQASAAHATTAAANSSGLGKWLPWLIAALVVIFGVSYCNKSKDPEPSAPPAQTTAPAPAEPAPEPVPEPAPVPAPAEPAEPAASSDPAASTATDSSLASATVTAPDGADVIDEMQNGMPVLRVFFDTGKTDVAPSFADKSTSLVEFLKANADVKAIISGFNDPTGDPARNAELSKQRAEAVKNALVAAGVAEDRAIMEKPAETTDMGVNNAAARRVDVVLRR